MGDINVSSVGDNNGVTPQYDNSMRYGVGLQFNKSLFSKGGNTVELGFSVQGYLPTKGKAGIDLSCKQKLSENFSIGGGFEGTYSIQKSKGSVNQSTFEHIEHNELRLNGIFDKTEPYNMTIVDPKESVVYVSSGDRPPEEGDVLDEVKISKTTLTAPNKRTTFAAKGFVEYQPNDNVSFTAGVKLGSQYDTGGKTLTKGVEYKSVISSSKYTGSWYDTTAGEPPYNLFDNYDVSSEIVKADYSSSTNNNDSQFKVGLFGEANYKLSNSLKIGAFGDTFHKEAGVKATFTF